jgi:NAD(P)H dehydrogenase (quinone)
MLHAVIVAHPNPESFTSAVARTYVKTVRQFGDSAVVRDLYAMEFDPRLRAHEIPTAAGVWRAGADVEAERAAIGEAEVFTLVYPWWFNAPPAILKGYVDRVLSLGFGYAARLGGTQPLLGGRRLFSISCSGAPDAWVRDTQALSVLRQGFDQHVANVTGLSVTDHLHLGGIVPGMTAEAGEELLDQVRNRVRQSFQPAA